jgi:putative endonuclease
MSDWTLYIVECCDGSLYTGITTDIDKRLKRHNEGKASRYTRSKRPVKLVYKKRFKSESLARKNEGAIKNLPRSEKLRIIKG